MENATKALLIGAGMLFAVAVVSMVLYTYTQITAYYNSKQDSQTTEQIAEFNNDFAAYDRTDVTGFELVSLINKIINYNAQNTYDTSLGFANSDKQWEKMYIEFKIKDSNLKYGIKDSNGNTVKLFSEETYNSEHSKTETELEQIIKDMQDLEKDYSASVLSKLVSNRKNLEIYGAGPEYAKSIKEVLGKEVNPDDLPDEDDVIKYDQYITFKRADFKCTGRKYNDQTGRLIKLVYEQN